ncbi:MAG: hypothetical protein ACHP8B_10835 [Terriglobales bacterium]
MKIAICKNCGWKYTPPENPETPLRRTIIAVAQLHEKTYNHTVVINDPEEPVDFVEGDGCHRL